MNLLFFRTGNLQNRRSALVPVATFPNSPANLVLGIFSSDLEYAGDKGGGMQLSPTCHLGIGGFYTPVHGHHRKAEL